MTVNGGCVNLAPAGSSGHLWNILDCHDLMRGDLATGIWCLEVRDAAETLKFTGQLPTTKNYLASQRTIWVPISEVLILGNPWLDPEVGSLWSIVWFHHQEPSNIRQNCLNSVNLLFLLCSNTDNASLSTNFWVSQYRSLWANRCQNAS